MLQQVADPLVKAFGAGKDNGVCQRVPADVADCLKPVVGKAVCGDSDRVAGPGKAFGHAAEKLGCEAEKLVPCIQEKADDLGAAGAQALCRAVWNVAETAGDFGNAFARRFRDPGVSGKGAGNRGHREACPCATVRKVGRGSFSAARPLLVSKVFRVMPVHFSRSLLAQKASQV